MQDDNDQEAMTVQPQIKHKGIQQKTGINNNVRKQVFSFRALLNDIDIWKAYATATGQTMEKMGAAAMNEYIERHKLSGAEQDIFTALKDRNEKQKNDYFVSL